jgi:rare lipoprotein A
LIGNRRVAAYAVPVLLSGLLALPALAAATTGGSALSSGGGAPASGGGTAPSAAPTGGPVSASSDGISFTTSATTMLRNQLSFSGTAPRSDAGKTIQIQRLGHETAWQWTPTVSAQVAPDGSFSAVWQTNHIGRFSIRVLVGQAGGAASASAAPTVTITVFRSSVATLYGPGFYGHRTACGQLLTRSTIGVANRTLRCGTKVAVLYRGRTMVVPVIDRGPYANSADWDLTEATGQALGMSGTARLGAVSLPPAPGA